MTKRNGGISNIPVVRDLVKLTKKIKLPGLGGFTLYHLLKIYVTGIFKGSFSPRASSIAYSFLLALFPFLLLMLNLIPYIPIEGFQDRFLLFVYGLLPPQTAEFFYPIIADIAINRRTTLLSFVFFLMLILSANGVNAIFSSFQYSFYVNINRNFFRQYLLAIAISLLLALVLLASVGAILYGEFLIQSINSYHIISNRGTYVLMVQFLIFVAMVYTSIAILYYFGTRKAEFKRFFSVGTIVTTLLFLATTYFFGVYINNFSNYNELYGSIGALMILMLYIWINSNLLLLGFELDVSIQRLKGQIKNK